MAVGVSGSAVEGVPLHVAVECSDMRGSVTIQHPRMVDWRVRDWITSSSSATPNAAQVTVILLKHLFVYNSLLSILQITCKHACMEIAVFLVHSVSYFSSWKLVWVGGWSLLEDMWFGCKEENKDLFQPRAFLWWQSLLRSGWSRCRVSHCSMWWWV